MAGGLPQENHCHVTDMVSKAICMIRGRYHFSEEDRIGNRHGENRE